MSDHKNNTTNTTIILLFVMLAAIAVQSWYMMAMQQKLDQLQLTDSGTEQVQYPLSKKNNSSNRLNAQNSTAYNDWFNRSFDPDSWDPLHEMQQMQDHMNQIFGNAFNRFDQSSHFNKLFKNKQFSPQIDVREEAERFVVKVDLPGVDNENVNVSLNEQTLTINGSIDQKKEQKDEQGRVISRERRSGKFNRVLTLPVPLKQDGMSTQVEKGVLEITLLKK